MSATALVGLAPTVLGPLTTVFTPPPACTVAVGQVDGGFLGLGLLGGGGPVDSFAFLGQSCNAGQPAAAASCWPPTTTGAPPPPADNIGRWGVYSPGIECPAGYATACAATAGGSTGWPLQFSLTAGETAVGCCPSGYGCANIGGQTCTMLATSTVIQTATCNGNELGAVETSSAAAFNLYAPMIQINFQSSDLPAATPAPALIAMPAPAAAAAAGAETFTTRTTTTIMAGSPSPTAASPSQNQTSLQPTPSSTDISRSSGQGTGPTTSPAAEQLQTTNTTTSPSVPVAGPTQSPTTAASDIQSSPSSTPSSPTGDQPTSPGLPRLAAVGIGVGGGVAALLIGGSALMYCLRRRRNRREEESLDRLYGLGKLDSSVTGSAGSDDFMPGFYRGQMPTRAGGSMRQVNF